jgi:hypothetical protein
LYTIEFETGQIKQYGVTMHTGFSWGFARTFNLEVLVRTKVLLLMDGTVAFFVLKFLCIADTVQTWKEGEGKQYGVMMHMRFA